MAKPINRTILELKHGIITDNGFEEVAINRTILELKRTKIIFVLAFMFSINRTILELKPIINGFFSRIIKLSIAPFWN